MRFKILLTALAMQLCLTGCGNFTLFPGAHKIAIQQGNMIEPDMVYQLKPGMTKAQVRFVLGTPLIADTFDQDSWDYYYSRTGGDGQPIYEKFSVYFEDGRLKSFKPLQAILHLRIKSKRP